MRAACSKGGGGIEVFEAVAFLEERSCNHFKDEDKLYSIYYRQSNNVYFDRI